MPAQTSGRTLRARALEVIAAGTRPPQAASRAALAVALVLIAGSLGLSSCKSSSPTKNSAGGAEATAQGGAGWYTSMGEFGEVLAELLPMVASERQFSAQENRGAIIARAEELSKVVHQVNFMAQPPYEDPGLRFISRRFDEQMKEVRTDLQAGRMKLARSRLREVTRYCIGCHTLREGVSPAASSDGESGIPASVRRLSPLDRADFYASIRRFDAAIMCLEDALKDPKWASQNPREWEEGIQKLLAILVRVKVDPSLSLEMVSRFFDSASYPKGLEKSARQWRRQIVEWRKNRKSLDQLRTPDQKLAQVKKWMAAGKSAGKSQPQAALVPNLLASHWLSQTLPQIPLTDAQRSQEALYLSGQVAESLSELNFWSVPEDYYESCVRVSSKGQYTEECRKGLARTILTRTSIQKLEDLPIDLRERIQGI